MLDHPEFPTVEELGRAIELVEEEMVRAGMWEVERPGEEAMENHGPYGQGVMSFEQWLRWVFVARVRHAMETGEEYPAGSCVADRAVLEWRRWRRREGVGSVVDALRQFDALFAGEVLVGVA